MKDIQVFLEFNNFYQHFIWGFGRIATPLTFMLKKIRILEISASITPGDNNVNIISKSSLKSNLSKSKKTKTTKTKSFIMSLNISINIRATGFLTPKAKIAFTQFKKVFTEALIF